MQSIYYSDRQDWLPLAIPGTDPWTQPERLLAVESARAPKALAAQSNLVEWTESAAASNRFYRVADQTDSDGDGLSDAAESLIHGTDPALFDSDGDGMPDGWELQHGFDPLDPADGAADADGDGIPNAAEYALGTDPNQSDTVVEVDPADAVLETKCVNYGEQRGGFEGYLNPSNYYLHAEMEYMHNNYYEKVDVDRNAKRLLSRRETGYPDEIRREWDLASWSLTQQVYHVTDYISGTSTNTYEGDVDIPLTYNTLFWKDYGTPSGFSPSSDTAAVTTNSTGETTAGYALSDLYTVQEFKYDVGMAFLDYLSEGGTALFDNIVWDDSHQLFIKPYYGYDFLKESYRYYTEIDQYSFAMEEYDRAVRDMADETEWMQLSAIQYRWKLTNAADVVYRVNTLHIFEPEDTNQTTVVEAVHRDYVKGTGTGGFIHTQPRFILPPDEEGAAHVDALKMEFVDSAGVGATELRISKWPNAFSGTNAVFNSEFIKTDPDQFSIRVEGLPENAGPFSIMLSTDDNGAVWNDGPNEMVLYEQSLGVYTSKTMILVSNEIDDNETYDGVDDVVSGVPDNSVNDRTHMALPGGTVHAALQLAGHTFETTAEVPLDGTVYLEMVVPLKENDEPMIDNSYVLEHIRVMKETFAQTGFKTHAYITHMDIPSGVNLDDGLIILDPDVYATNWVDQETAIKTDTVHIIK